MFNKYRIKITIVLLTLMLFALLLDMHNLPITGKATTADVQSEVDIQVYFAITASYNFTQDGIKFNISSLPTIHANATGNYDGGSKSVYNITSSTDTNVNIDTCIKANANLTSGGNVITINNYKWSNDTNTNASLPNISTMRSLNTTFAVSITGIAAGGVAHYRFWLNVSGSQQAGVYNNTVNFKGVQTSGAC